MRKSRFTEAQIIGMIKEQEVSILIKVLFQSIHGPRGSGCWPV